MKKESLIWRIHKKNSGKVHYLMGTMHMKSEGAYNMVDLAEKYISKSTLFAGEMDLEDVLLGSIEEVFISSTYQSLVEAIGEKKYRKYKKVMKKSFGVDLDMIQSYKPIVILNILTEKLVSEDYELALDHYLWGFSKKMELPCCGLESFVDQKLIMSAIPFEYQLKALKSCMKNVRTFKKQIKDVCELYERAELTKLYKSTKKSMGKLRKMMIYDRNIKMAKRFVELTEGESIFCAVGAGHLSGAKGMLRLLKKEGYKVTPVFD